MTWRKFVETTAVAGGALVGCAVPWRQGAGLRAGAQGALSAVDQLRSRRRRRDRPAGRRVHEGHRHRDDGREDQPERHGGADHRRGRERQRRRRDPDERQPAALFANGLADHNALIAEMAGDRALRLGARRRHGGRRRPGRAAVQHRQCDRLSQGRVRGARPRRAEHLGRLSRGRPGAQEQQPAGRPDARPHVRRRSDLRLSADVELRRTWRSTSSARW